MTDEVQGANGAAEANAPQLNVQRIYVKDVSYESPNSPAMFQKEWKPEVQLDLDTRTETLAENVYEVILKVTTTVTIGEETAFLCEVHQAGIFTISDMPEAQLAHALGAYCPNMLFPYARECISNMVNRGSFPQLNLAPVNFDQIFAAYMQQQAEQAQGQQADA